MQKWQGLEPHHYFHITTWHGIDRSTGQVLAYVFGKRKGKVFLKLKELLEPFGIQKYCTDG
jgi:insertion element IS1 protein InsB